MKGYREIVWNAFCGSEIILSWFSAVDCDAVDKVCYCDAKGGDACSVADTVCDTNSRACVCASNLENVAGVCVQNGR